jgi:Leucine-rich repeat (LRR) protein
MSYLLNYIWGDSAEIVEFIYQTGGNPTDIKESTKNLEQINLDTIVSIKLHNQILKQIPIFIEKLTNLTTLIIEDCQIDILDMNILNNLKLFVKIIFINLKVNQFIESDKLKLESIIINKCPIIKFEFISKITSLREIYYVNNTNVELSNLSELSKLTILDLHNNNINSIDTIGKVSNLISINLGENNIESIEPLKYCENLKYLYINKNKIESIECLKNLHMITYLIANNNKIKNIDVITNFLFLEVLHIDDNLIKRIPNLLKLKNIDYDNLHIDWKIIEEVDDMKGFKLIKNIIFNLIKK